MRDRVEVGRGDPPDPVVVICVVLSCRVAIKGLEFELADLEETARYIGLTRLNGGGLGLAYKSSFDRLPRLLLRLLPGFGIAGGCVTLRGMGCMIRGCPPAEGGRGTAGGLVMRGEVCLACPVMLP